MKQSLLLVCLFVIFSVPGFGQLSKVDSLEQVLDQINDKEQQLAILINLGEFFLYKNPNRSIDYFNEAIVISSNLDKPADPLLFILMGTANWSKGELGQALKYMNQGLHLANQQNNNDLIAMANNGKGVIFGLYGNHELAFNYFDRALEGYEKLQNNERIVVLHNNLGRSKLEIGQADSARLILHQGLSKMQEENHPIHALMLLNYAESFFALGQLDSAKYYLTQTQMLAKKYDKTRAKLKSICLLSEIALLENASKEALRLSQSIIKQVERTGVKEMISKCYLTHANALAQNGAFQKAFYFHQRHLNVKDSLHQSLLAKQSLLHSYEEKELELALAREKAHNISIRSRQKSMLIIGLSLLFAMTLLLAIAFWRLRNLEKKARQALSQSEAKYRLLAERSSDGVFTLDPKQNISYISPSLQRLLGKDKQLENANFQKLLALVHPEDREKIVTSHRDAIQGHIQYLKYQYRIKHREGHYIWVEDAINFEFNENGILQKVYANCREVTDRVKAEVALKRSTNFLRETQEIALLGGWEWNLASEEMVWSNQVYHILGVNKQTTPLISSFTECFAAENVLKIETAFQKLTTYQPFDLELPLIMEGGARKWVRLQGKPILDNHQYQRAIGFIQDITSKKEMEEIKKLAQQLEIRNKEMEQFAYVASHDLQEPLRTVISFVQLLEKNYKHQFDEVANQYLDFIVEATHRMSALIVGLLNYSRLGRNPKSVQIDCQNLLDNVRKDLKATLDDHNATLTVKDMPTINGYAIELRQLFQNLISNGIKFHRQGIAPIIEIGAKETPPYWHFWVKDNGIGIASSHQNKIFNIFKRLHSSNEYEGTGIGLANCKKIVELHHGNIWVESEVGSGSVFHFLIKNLDH